MKIDLNIAEQVSKVYRTIHDSGVPSKSLRSITVSLNDAINIKANKTVNDINEANNANESVNAEDKEFPTNIIYTIVME